MAGLSQGFAVIIVLFVTLLWGSWFQVVKHTGKYPIVGFIVWLYAFSLVIVWGSIALLQRRMVPGGVFNEIASNVPLSLLIVFCGAMYAIAMQLQLTVVGRIGLILSTSVSATCSILCGTAVSSFFAGLPEGTSFFSIFFASILLVLATITCQYAGVRRDRDKGLAAGGQKTVRKKDILLLVLANGVLLSFYPLATSLGLRSALRPQGFSSLTCMGLLSIGALLGTSAFAAVVISKSGEGRLFWHPAGEAGGSWKKILLLALIAAFCHFGGNVLHAIAAPVVSVAIATAMGNSFHMWSYVWGLLYGEFKGAKPKTYLCLLGGMLLFIVGVLLLSLSVV